MNVEINKDVKLSEHFSLGEMTKTSVKTKDGNIPSRVQIENLKRLCGWLERLRQRCNEKPHPLTPSPKGEGEAYGSEGREEPIIINSAYRSPQVNKAVGGAQNSNHLTGCAVDIRCEGIEQAIRYAFILLDISDESKEDFDELLIEQSAKSSWVHFAVRPEGNRRKVEFLKKY